jgi:hypothetical protein
VSDNEAEVSFITSPGRTIAPAMVSSRQRRREMTAAESPSIRPAAETAVVEDIHSPTGDKSSSSVSSVSMRNKAAGNRRTQFFPVSEVITVNFKVMSAHHGDKLPMPFFYNVVF